MSRTIAVAAAIFASLAFILHHQVLKGPMAEPVLLLTMGSFFLLAARVTDREKVHASHQEEPEHVQPVLLAQQQRVSA